MNPLSVILHCDLDCFYAQVERERLNLPKDAAVAVIQWTSALAVSYPARKYGIKRGSTVDDIKRLAPPDAVHVVHVETISVNGDGNGDPSSAPATQAPNIQSEKVSLARYRRASAAVFDALNSETSAMHLGTVVERASIDEAYVDVSAEVDRRIRRGDPVPPFSDGTHIEGSDLPVVLGGLAGTVEVPEEHDGANPSQTTDGYRRLAFGAAIAKKLRQCIAAECGYTMSAGISVNKLVAKFASAAHKPNQQTVVPVHAVERLLEDVPLTRIRGLGGKLGREISAALNGFDEAKRDDVVSVGEARRLSIDGIQRVLKCDAKTARFVHRSVRGLDDAPVTKRDAPRSLLAAKSFSPEGDISNVKRTWLPLLASELVTRLEEDGRVSNTLTVSFRATHDGKPPFFAASRAIPMPCPTTQQRSLSRCIVDVTTTLLNNILHEGRFKFPLNFIGLTATNFVQRTSEREKISRFFRKSSGSEQFERPSAGPPTVKDDSDGIPPTSPAPHCANSNVQSVSHTQNPKKLQEKSDREIALRLQREETIISLQNVSEVPQPGGGQRSSTSSPSRKSAQCSNSQLPQSLTTPNSSKSSSFSERHQRRLQEKADRELARKLHREENCSGVKKAQKNSSNTPKKMAGPAKRLKKGSSKNVETAGVPKLDRFFKSQRR